MSGTEKFLEQNVRPVLQPMIRAVLADKPKDPVHPLYLTFLFI